MAKIKKIKLGQDTIYPATVPQAIEDPNTKEKLSATLPKLAEHGYEENPKTLKEIDDSVSQLAGDTSVKLPNLLQNSSFENGDIAPIYRADGNGGVSTLSINTINPISGNYDARLEMTTPATTTYRPFFYLNGSQDGWVPNHIFYFGMSVKVNSGTPIINTALNGDGAISLNLTLKDGFNSWTVKCLGLEAFAVIRLDGSTLWDFNFDNLIAYDLTAIFGEGNEPTKEEMDLLISTSGIEYFEGEITIPSQKIMQWQRKLRTQLESDVSLFKDESNLKDAIQGAKIKDIENVLSTANLNQSAQLSVSGLSPLSLPKNASNGGMDVKLEGLTAENLVENGDFRDGANGWVVLANTATISDKITFNGEASAATGVYTDVPSSIDNKIYLKFKATNEGETSLRVSIYDYDSFDNIEWLSNRVMETESTIFNSLLGGVRLYFRQGGSGETYINATIDDVMCIDLTETFGAGNEPTKEECDLIFSDYFEGVKSFNPTGRVRSVGRNLIDLANSKFLRKITGASITIDEGRTVWNLTDPYNNVKDKVLFAKFLPNKQYMVRSIGKRSSGSALFMVLTYSDNTTENIPIGGANGIYGENINFSNPAKSLTAISFGSGANGTAQIDIPSFMISETQNGTPVPYEPYKETNLYLTAPELRSNGLVKDEIRKGTNGYELAKRVVPINADSLTWDYHISWETDNYYSVRASTPDITVSFDVIDFTLVNYGGVYSVDNLAQAAYDGLAVRWSGVYLYIKVPKTDFAELPTDLTVKNWLTSRGIKRLTASLATPEIIPISYGGVLNSAENGTVYHEPIIADAGVYGANLPILLTDYPIASIEEIIKHENGVDTYLNVASAVIESDGLSFTHPDLADGDLVLFTYAFDKESTNGNITATFYDSNVVKIDTATGKAYKIEEVVTNGVLTRTLIEV